MPSETPQDYFPILFGLSLLWVSVWVVASVLYRRSRGKPIMFRGVPDALFVESTASGHSNRSWFTKLGGASRCLVVAVYGKPPDHPSAISIQPAVPAGSLRS